MDVSFSAWRHSREESLQLKGDSFSFLFDRRYTNRLNRMSRVFFEAYVVATKELAAQEDRFPSLSEIDAKMESGAVYAFKDRLMKNTEFFEEVKISGVSYLVPRALKFVDVTGTYTDLILNFEEGTTVLPTRRKTATLPESQVPGLEEAEEPMTPAADEAAKKGPTPAQERPEMLTRSLFTQIVESVLKSGNTVPDHATRLTRREKEIVDLISEGMSNKEIAQQLHIATFTVKSHVHNVLEKLELNTRLQIAAFVRDGREK